MKKIPFDLIDFKNQRFAIRCKTREEAERFFQFITTEVGEPLKVRFSPYGGDNIGWRLRHRRNGVYYYIFYSTWDQRYYLNATNSPVNNWTIKFEELQLGNEIEINGDILLSLLGAAS